MGTNASTLLGSVNSESSYFKKEPLKRNLFIFQMSGFNFWYAKSVTKPVINFENGSSPIHDSVTFNGTRKIKDRFSFSFGEITVKLSDFCVTLNNLGCTTGVALFNKIFTKGLRSGGYNNKYYHHLRSRNNLGDIKIYQFATNEFSTDLEIVETWTLIRPSVTKLELGMLDYSSDELQEITLSIEYEDITVDCSPHSGTGSTSATTTRPAIKASPPPPPPTPSPNPTQAVVSAPSTTPPGVPGGSPAPAPAPAPAPSSGISLPFSRPQAPPSGPLGLPTQPLGLTRGPYAEPPPITPETPEQPVKKPTVPPGQQVEQNNGGSQSAAAAAASSTGVGGGIGGGGGFGGGGGGGGGPIIPEEDAPLVLDTGAKGGSIIVDNIDQWDKYKIRVDVRGEDISDPLVIKKYETQAKAGFAKQVEKLALSGLGQSPNEIQVYAAIQQILEQIDLDNDTFITVGEQTSFFASLNPPPKP